MIGESPWKVLNLEGLSEFVALEARREHLLSRMLNLIENDIPITKEEQDDLEIDSQIFFGDCKAFYKKWRKE